MRRTRADTRRVIVESNMRRTQATAAKHVVVSTPHVNTLTLNLIEP